MKFAFFTGHYFPHLGGVERYTKELASRVAACGNECRIITNNTERAPAEETMGSLRIHRLPAWNSLSHQFPVTFPSPALVRILAEISRWRPHWIVTNTRYFPINLIATLANIALFRTNHLHIEHGSDYVRFPSSFMTRISMAYDSRAARLVCGRATVCVGVSRAVTSFMEGTFRCQFDGVLHNAVDTAAVDPNGPSMRERLGIATGAPVFGFAGRLVPEKGVLEVLAAFRGIERSLHGGRLLIAGAGPLEEEVRRQARGTPSVHYLGPLDASGMASFYRTVDIFAYPTSYPEGFPTVILEAGAYGKLVITTERGSARDAIRDPSCGVIIPEHDCDALARAMEQYALRREERETIGANLRNVVCERFDWERTLHDFLDLVGRYQDSVLRKGS
jgi:glycosyltransferase involved in cell wall biosynthesis